MNRNEGQAREVARSGERRTGDCVSMRRPATLLAQAGSRWDERTGAVTMPIYQTATFRHPGLGESTGFDYSRTSNPTRSVLEATMAELEGGARAAAFASGLAAIDAVLSLLPTPGRLIACQELYGGTFRLLERVHRPRGLKTEYVDASDIQQVRELLAGGAAAILIESPSNPLLNVADIRAIAGAARESGALTIVDNTFLTPWLQRPLELGADLVVYSATKYLAGHNDVLGGLVVAGSPELGDGVLYRQNAIGAVLGPQDSWLLLRGLKTLAVRMERQESNAMQVARWLDAHPRVPKVYYPGLDSHPGHGLLAQQSRGFGAMVSFEVDRPERVRDLLAGVRTLLFAESLGGVESLVTFPVAQTHADVDAETRERLGINDRLLRLSIGLEDASDLIADLERLL